MLLQFLVKSSALNLSKNSGPPLVISIGSFHKDNAGSYISFSFKAVSDSSFATDAVPGSV